MTDKNTKFKKLTASLQKGQKGDWEKEGYKISHVPQDNGSIEVQTHHKGKKVGFAAIGYHDYDNAEDENGTPIFSKTPTDQIMSYETEVDPEHRRKGLATAMYQYAERHFKKPMEMGSTSPDAQALWRNRRFGKSNDSDVARMKIKYGDKKQPSFQQQVQQVKDKYMKKPLKKTDDNDLKNLKLPNQTKSSVNKIPGPGHEGKSYAGIRVRNGEVEGAKQIHKGTLGSLKAEPTKTLPGGKDRLSKGVYMGNPDNGGNPGGLPPINPSAGAAAPMEMSKAENSHSDWLEHHGKTVKVDGKRYKIHATSHQAVYPYKHTAHQAHAEMVNKNDPEYLATKKQLGDHWVTDLKEPTEFSSKVMAAASKPKHMAKASKDPKNPVGDNSAIYGYTRSGNPKHEPGIRSHGYKLQKDTASSMRSAFKTPDSSPPPPPPPPSGSSDGSTGSSWGGMGSVGGLGSAISGQVNNMLGKSMTLCGKLKKMTSCLRGEHMEKAKADQGLSTPDKLVAREARNSDALEYNHKGVNPVGSSDHKGQSVAGDFVRSGKAQSGKAMQRDRLGELKSMPKPNLPGGKDRMSKAEYGKGSDVTVLAHATPHKKEEEGKIIDTKSFNGVTRHLVSHPYEDQGRKIAAQSNNGRWYTNKDLKSHSKMAKASDEPRNPIGDNTPLGTNEMGDSDSNGWIAKGKEYHAKTMQKKLAKAKVDDGLSPQNKATQRAKRNDRQLSSPDSKRSRGLSFHDKKGALPGKKGEKVYGSPKKEEKGVHAPIGKPDTYDHAYRGHKDGETQWDVQDKAGLSHAGTQARHEKWVNDTGRTPGIWQSTVAEKHKKKLQELKTAKKPKLPK